jgi:hypothetical protein
MLVVMIFQRFLGHMGRKGVIGIGEIGERECHGVMSENDGRRGLTGTLIEGSAGLKHPIWQNVGAFGAAGARTIDFGASASRAM